MRCCRARYQALPPVVLVAQREATEHARKHRRAAGCVRSEERDCWRDRVGKHVAGVDVQMVQQWEGRAGWWRGTGSTGTMIRVGFGADDDGQGAEGLLGKKQDLPEMGRMRCSA